MSMTCSLVSISPFIFPYSQISRHSKIKQQTTTTSSDFVEQNGLLIRLTAAAGGPLTLHPCLYHMLRLCHNRIKPHFSTQFECGHMLPLPSSVLFIRTNDDHPARSKRSSIKLHTASKRRGQAKEKEDQLGATLASAIKATAAIKSDHKTACHNNDVVGFGIGYCSIQLHAL